MIFIEAPLPPKSLLENTQTGIPPGLSNQPSTATTTTTTAEKEEEKERGGTQGKGQKGKRGSPQRQQGPGLGVGESPLLGKGQ